MARYHIAFGGGGALPSISATSSPRSRFSLSISVRTIGTTARVGISAICGIEPGGGPCPQRADPDRIGPGGGTGQQQQQRARGVPDATRDLLARRGRKTDPTWANRRLLLRGRERLSEQALARMWNGCVDNDPTGQILSAWIAKEELRVLCATAAAGGHRHEIHQRLWAFYRWCADARIPELTTLAETIETWWPAIEVFLTTGLTNARTEARTG